jgi:Abortive infection alpha
MLNTDSVSDELVQAAKAAAELEPAVEAFAEATGALEPVRESTGWLGDVIRYRREVHLAKVLMKAAEKVKASGLPAHAVRDKLLRAVVEDGSMEDDEGMQERWATLLANAATDDEDRVKTAFPQILSELEPSEAALLDELFDLLPDPNAKVITSEDIETEEGLAALDNLNRLGLVRYVRSMPTTLGSISDRDAEIEGYKFTQLGWDFVKACNPPS